MASLNQVSLVGNVTRDVEIRTAGKGSVAQLGLAINDRVKRGNDWVDEVTFIDVEVWNQQADFAANYCGKGASVFEVLSEIRRASKIDFEVDVQSRRPGDPPYLCADVSRIKNELGWAAKHNLAEIIDSAWQAKQGSN
jgi:GDP-D-mannose dehydratase